MWFWCLASWFSQKTTMASNMAAIYSLWWVITTELLGIDTWCLCLIYGFLGQGINLCVFSTKIDKNNVNKIKDGVQYDCHIHACVYIALR